MNDRQLREALVAALRDNLSTGKRPALPEAGQLWWQLFGEIGRSRTFGPGGPNPIAYAEIEAYCRLHRWPLQPHHVAILRAMDDAWLEHDYGVQDMSGATASRSSGQAINPAAFDAVFG